MGARHPRGLRGIPQGGLDTPDDGRDREGVGRLPLTIAKVLRAAALFGQQCQGGRAGVSAGSRGLNPSGKFPGSTVPRAAFTPVAIGLQVSVSRSFILPMNSGGGCRRATTQTTLLASQVHERLARKPRPRD